MRGCSGGELLALWWQAGPSELFFGDRSGTFFLHFGPLWPNWEALLKKKRKLNKNAIKALVQCNFRLGRGIQVRTTTR